MQQIAYRTRILPLALSVWAALAMPLMAQDQGTAAPQAGGDQPAQAQTPDPGLSTGEKIVNGRKVGEIYVKEKSGDWELRCVQTESGNDPCRLYQLMKDQAGNPVVEISLFDLPPGGQAVAGATVATPLETLLTEQLTITLDGGIAKRYPFSYCTVKGCYARIGLTAEDLAAFKKGAKGTVSIVPLAAPDKRVEVTLSLKGFTKGYEHMVEANARARN